jgi:hypothetical protein
LQNKFVNQSFSFYFLFFSFFQNNQEDKKNTYFSLQNNESFGTEEIKKKQEFFTKEKEGTSETIREAIFKNSNFDFTDFQKNKPIHIKNYDNDFLIWFIGFFEGDGSF